MARRVDFTRIVWTVVIAISAVLLVLALAFQSLAASYKDTPSAFAVIQESRSLWIGDFGIFPLVLLFTLIGLIASYLPVLSKSLRNSVESILQLLAELVMRGSHTASWVKDKTSF